MDLTDLTSITVDFDVYTFTLLHKYVKWCFPSIILYHKEMHKNVKTYPPKPCPYDNVCPGANTIFWGDALS